MSNNALIEKVKEYWDKRPCNIRYSPSPIGTKEYFDEVEARKYFVEPHIPLFAEFAKWQGKKVLEIGCGIGTDTINFARAGAEVAAVEISEKSLDLTRQRAKVYGLENKIKFYLGNAEELSKFVPVESYDLIYSFGVIHHTPHPERVIEEIKKYTYPKTIIKIMIYHRYSWPVAWIVLRKGRGAFWKLDELVARYSESQNCPIIYTYSKRGARELLSGFKILNIKVEQPVSRAHFFLRRRDKFVFNKIILPLLDFFSRPFGWHLLITAKPL